MQALGINPGFLLAQIVNFILMVLILRSIAFEPILNLLEQRSQRIAKAQEDARLAAEARANADRDYQKRIDEARIEAQRILNEANQRAEQVRQSALGPAQAQAEKLVADARGAAAEERNRILGEAREQIIDIAMAAARKVVGASFSPDGQRTMLTQFFGSLDESKLAALRGVTGPITVRTALPLADAEQSNLRQQIASRVGANQVNFEVDPEMLGGVTLIAGDKVIDASVNARLNALRTGMR